MGYILHILLLCSVLHAQIFDTPEALLQSAERFFYSKDTAAAWACLERIHDTHGSEPRWLFLAGRTRAAQGRHEDAVRYFSGLLSVDPGCKGVHAARGAAYIKLGNYTQALADLQRALMDEPENSFLLGRAAYALERLGRYHEAYALQLRANTVQEHPAGFYRAAAQAEALGYYQAAHDLYCRAAALGYTARSGADPLQRAARVLYRLAVEQKRGEAIDSARQLFSRVEKLYPDSVYGMHAVRQAAALEWLMLHRDALLQRIQGVR